ncbi:MAG: DNA double-strand break repair nuclease NurA [Dehalococcoidia bacterium]
MTLRMDQVAARLPGVVDRYEQQRAEIERGLDLAGRALDRWAADPEAGNARIAAAMAGRDDPYALTTAENPGRVGPVPGDPAPGTVVAVDGSDIGPDRFSAVRCYVLNIGRVALPYGVPGEPALEAEATVDLEAVPGDGEPGPPVTAQSLRLYRDVRELQEGIALAERRLDHGPVTLLLDGTLLPWDLHGRQVTGVALEWFRGETKAALDRGRDVARSHQRLAVGGYISGSAARDVVTSLRELADGVATAWPLSDAQLFARILEDGQRSAVFAATSNRPERVEQYLTADHAVRFFYLRVGADIARVEVPAWAADAARVEQLHATLVQQCRLCGGYPRALQEAHEQAVISSGDRQQFARLLEHIAGGRGLRALANGKSMSKRRRAL